MAHTPLPIDYAIATAADLDEMTQLLAAVFSQVDPPAVAAALTAAEFAAFVRLFWQRVLDEELTIIARRRETGMMVGVLLTEDAAAAPPAELSQLSPKFLPIFDILGQLDAAYREGKHIQPGQYLHLFLLGVAKQAMGLGVAQQLVTACLQHGQRRGYTIAITEATNSVSQHIFRKQGFTDRVTRSYRDYRYAGQAIFADIEGHAGPILMERVIGP